MSQKKTFTRNDVQRAIEEQHGMLYIEANLLDLISDMTHKDVSRPSDIVELLRNVAGSLENISAHLMEIHGEICNNFHCSTWTPFSVSDHPDDNDESKSISELVKYHTEDCTCKACKNKRSWNKIPDDYDPFLDA